MDWQNVREQFPPLRNWTYLNTASFGLVPLLAREAVDRHFDRRDEHACQDFLAWFDDMDEIRLQAARLIGCQAGDIAFTINASTPLSYFLGGIDWQPGDRIATLEHEFPNQYAFPGKLAERGVELLELRDLTQPLPARTRAVLASTVSYTTGKRADLLRLRELADAARALFYVDGTQSVGALRFDVNTVKPDMLAVDAYKWMISPNGAGFFYVSPELRRVLEPPVIGWRSDRDWRSVTSLHHGPPRFSETAEKYEAGMISFPSLYAMGESLRLLHEIGMDHIEGRVLELSGFAAATLKRAGAEILFEGGNILSAGWPGRDMGALAEELKASRISTVVRKDRLRVSTHFYNNEEDIETLARHL